MKSIKTILVFAFLFTISSVSVSQDCYTVMKVKGTVYNFSKGKNVTANDELCTSDQLVFKSNNSVVVVHSSSKGRFTLKSKAADSKSEFSCVMGDVLKQSSSGNLSSRAVTSLQDEFTGDYNIIGNSLKIKVEDKKYIMNDNTFFYLQYKYNGEDVNKKLEFSSDTLIFPKNKIFILNDSEINQEDVENISLLYYDKVNKVSKLISSFKITFLDESTVKTEVQKVLDIAKSLNKNEKDTYKDVLSYMTDAYGNFNVEYFEQWYKNNFKN